MANRLSNCYKLRMAGQYNRKDSFYKQAKESGYRSRAAYKLIELNKKYRIFKPGYKIVDLGAWPGGWMQVAGQKVGSSGLVVGIDLVPIEDFKASNIKVIKGDVRDEVNLDQALTLAGQKFDVLLSDMSAKLTGIKEVDRIAALGCAELALWGASKLLKKGGGLAMKVFKGNEIEMFVKKSRPIFNKLTRSELKSTRKTSNEYYLVGAGFDPDKYVE